MNDIFEHFPTAAHALNFPPHVAKDLLSHLEPRIASLMNAMPWRGMSALKTLTQALPPHPEHPSLKDFFHLRDNVHVDALNSVNPSTLNDIFEHLIRFNKIPEDYREESFFYRIVAQKPERLDEFDQKKIKRTLSELQSIQYLINDISEYWQPTQDQNQVSKQAYLSHLFATQLQCAATLSFSQRTLSLEGRKLIAQLCALNKNSAHHINDVFIQNYDMNDHIHMVGAFVISQHSAASSTPDNPCVLFVPGQPLTEFESLDALKMNLAGLINENVQHTLLACTLNSRRQEIEEELDAESIILAPITSHADFYINLIGSLLEKQKLDIIYSMASVSPEMTRTPYWAEHITRSAADLTPILTFATTLRQEALANVNNTRLAAPDQDENTLPIETILPTTSSSPAPININIYVHPDLSGIHNETLEYNYLSWIKTELNHITKRDISLVFFYDTNESPFNYKNEKSEVSLALWKAAMYKRLKLSDPLNPLNLYLLLTKEKINSRILGTAFNKGQFSIASIKHSSTAAHEIGHMLGATHEDGGIIYNGWWHDSPMAGVTTDFFSFLRGHAQRFSDKNRENIRQYVSQLT